MATSRSRGAPTSARSRTRSSTAARWPACPRPPASWRWWSERRRGPLFLSFWSLKRRILSRFSHNDQKQCWLMVQDGLATTPERLLVAGVACEEPKTADVVPFRLGSQRPKRHPAAKTSSRPREVEPLSRRHGPSTSGPHSDGVRGPPGLRNRGLEPRIEVAAIKRAMRTTGNAEADSEASGWREQARPHPPRPRGPSPALWPISA